MTSADATRPDTIPTQPAFRNMLRRLVGMLAVWVGIGVVLGLLAGHGTGLIALAASLTAGIIVMVPVGVLLTLVGGRRDESLSGGVIGLIGGAAVGVIARQTDPRQFAVLGMVCGALLGATVIAAFYRLPRLIRSRLAPRTTSGSPQIVPQ